MRILIVSDTHGRDRSLEEVISRVSPIDMLIHCGDSEGHEDYIGALVDCPVHMVRGNNDFFTQLPEEDIFFIGNQKVLLTHGHAYGVSFSLKMLLKAAKEKGADIVMYGHTHVPKVSLDGVSVINPGSLTYPRQEGRKPSFILMELDPNNQVHFHLNYLNS